MIDLTDFFAQFQIFFGAGLIVFLLILIFFAKFPEKRPVKK